MLLQRVAGTILRYNMLPPGARTGVALSGGADSVFLLHALHRLGYAVHALHLNHQLRGEESAADERFAAGMAGSLGVPFYSACATIGAGNLEAAARRARLAFFRAALGEFGLAAVATGHTLSDQAETVLFRALRGSGPAGLAAIQPVTAEGLIRPLIEVEGDELRQWLTGQGIEWREDSSNQSSRFARNRIRAEVLPLLRSILPQSDRSLARLARLARDENEWWDARIDEAWQPVAAGDGVQVFNVHQLAGLAPVAARRLLRRALPSGCTPDHIDAVLRLVHSPSGTGSATLPRALVRRSFDLLRIDSPPQVPVAPAPVSIASPGLYPFAGTTVSVIESEYNVGSRWIDAGLAPLPWFVRGWRPGDVYQPAGGHHPSKLKELFHRGQVPSWERPEWPIILIGNRILWSRRFGVAAWAAAGPGSRRVLEVRHV